MQLMFEFTIRPKMRCSSDHCVGKTVYFPPDGWPQPSVDELIRQWREFRR